MGALNKAIGFLLILNLLCQIHSTHHEEAMKSADRPLTLEQFRKHIE